MGDDLDLWNNVLVEEDWVTEVHLELGDGPELLEEWRLNISLEDGWVLLPELTEEGDLEVLSEEWVGHEFLKREDGHTTLGPGLNIIVSVVGGWGEFIRAVKKGFLQGKGREPMGVGELVLQKPIVPGKERLFL